MQWILYVHLSIVITRPFILIADIHKYKIVIANTSCLREKTFMNFEEANLKVAIGSCVFGQEIRSFKEISSTQDYAISIAETDPYCHGMLIISESQLFGRGRMRRRWISPPGGLWFSVIVKSEIKTSSSLFLSYAMSLAVCETI